METKIMLIAAMTAAVLAASAQEETTSDKNIFNRLSVDNVL